jgi:hypothetical protein
MDLNNSNVPSQEFPQMGREPLRSDIDRVVKHLGKGPLNVKIHYMGVFAMWWRSATSSRPLIAKAFCEIRSMVLPSVTEPHLMLLIQKDVEALAREDIEYLLSQFQPPGKGHRSGS